MLLKLVTVVSILFLVNVSPAKAECDQTGTVVLTEEEQSLDVLGRNPVIISTNYLSKIKVVEEYAGFECEIVREEGSLGCFKTYVEWSPGADVSGCRVEVVELTGDLESKFLNLYMNY